MGKTKLLCLLLITVLLGVLQSCSRYEVPKEGTLATIRGLVSRNEDDSALTLLQHYHLSPTTPETPIIISAQ